MRAYRLLIVIILLMLSFTAGTIFAQDEATEEPEATEIVVESEMTEEAEATEVIGTSDEGSVYVVQRGDTLFSIARRNGLTTDDLAEVNNIANPARIFVGQRIVIPGLLGGGGVDSGVEIPAPVPSSTATPAPEIPPVSSTHTYVVQPGDNLFRIALRNNTTVNQLKSLNPGIVNSNLIFVGQSINLLGEGSDSVSSSLDITMSRGIEVLLGDNISENASALLELDVEWVKITVLWAIVEPEEGIFDFSALDAAIDAFEGANPDIRIMLTLTAAPDWSRPSSTALALEQPTYGPPDDLATFATFAGEVAGRYVGRVDAYEIWSQPNKRLNWMTTDVTLRSDGFPDAHLSETAYIDLLRIAYNAIKENDSDALVITAGLEPTAINDDYNAISNDVFFEALLQQGASEFSDGFGIHVDGYSNAPDARCCGETNVDPEYDEVFQYFFADTLNTYRSIMNRNGASDSPLWITHFGWGTTEGASGDGSAIEFVRSNSAQDVADYIEQAFAIGEERGDVALMIQYNLNGCAVSDTRACYYSLNKGSDE